MENGQIGRDLLLFSINKRITITVQTLIRDIIYSISDILQEKIETLQTLITNGTYASIFLSYHLCIYLSI